MSSFLTGVGLGPAWAYRTVPANTKVAPRANRAETPEPNHQTLRQRLAALRAVRTRFVVTDDTLEVRLLTPETQTAWVMIFIARTAWSVESPKTVDVVVDEASECQPWEISDHMRAIIGRESAWV